MSRGDRVALAVIVAVVTLMFSDVLFFGRSFYFRDVTRFYYPMEKVTRDIIRSGEFPSWNPFLSEGQPLAANPEFEVFYPPNWLLLLPDFELAFRLHLILHYYLAAIGVYLLLRRHRLRIESAMFGAFAYTFGGLLLSLSCLHPYLFCLAWLPWIAYFIGRESRRDAALAAICIAMIFLGGEPVTIAQTVLIAVAYAVWMRRRIATIALVIVAAVLIASVQIVPAADHLRDSVRSRPFEFSLVSTWSTPPVKAVELFIAGALGPVRDHAAFYWGTAIYGWLDPFFLSIYPGLLVAALAIAAIVLRRTGWNLVAIALIGGFVLALGSRTPLLRLFYDLRLFSSFRYPEKFLILAIVPLTAFAAYAFDRLVDGDGEIARVALVIAAIVSIVCAILIAFASRDSYANAFIRFWEIYVHPLRYPMAQLSARAWTLGLLRALAVVALLLMRTRMRAHAWARVALLLLVVDLGIERPSLAETVPSTFFRQRPASVPPFPPGVRLFHQADWYSGIPIARSYFDRPEMYWVLRNGAYPHMNAVFGIPSALNRDIDRTSLLPTADLVAAMSDVRGLARRWVERLAAISNVGYRAVFMPPERAGRGVSIRPIVFVPVAGNPRFYFAGDIGRCVSRADLVRFLLAPPWPRRAACIAATPFVPSGGEVLEVTERSNAARLRVRASGEALLVISITRHKYWHASIDGAPAALLPVNLAYQGLRVRAGDHAIELWYDNPLIRWFGLLSAVALLVTLALAAKPTTEKREPTTS